MIKYSVIIPHKDSYSYLLRLINTIPNRNDIEVIIVDDHSDETVFNRIETHFATMDNFYVLSSLGFGAGTARNYGMKCAHGKWLLFADADDKFTLDSFANMDKYCLNQNDLVYFMPITQGIVSADYRVHYKRMFERYFSNINSVNEWEIRLNFDVPWSKVVKKDFVQENFIWFDQTQKHNDTIFSQKVGINAKHVAIINKSIYIAIDNSKSVTHRSNKKLFDDMVDVRIRSYLLKRNHFSKQFLLNNDSHLFQEPLSYLWNSIKFFKSFGYSASVYRKFKEKKISVFTVCAFVRFLKEKLGLII